jgi:hypothetical protein
MWMFNAENRNLWKRGRNHTKRSFIICNLHIIILNIISDMKHTPTLPDYYNEKYNDTYVQHVF